jgi:tetratricopeptide (TPR) repeat protein
VKNGRIRQIEVPLQKNRDKMKENNHDFLFDDESQEVVHRYEQAVQNRTEGYFDVEELEVIVDYYLNCGKPKESSKAIDLGMKLHPGSSTLQTKRAKVFLASGETHKALQLLERINNPDDIETQLLKGDALLRLHRDTEAHAIFARLLENDETELNYISLDIAHIYIANNYYKQALVYLEKGLTAVPTDIDLLQDAAFCYEQTDQEETAIDYYNRVINVDAYSIEAWFNLGLVYFNQSDFTRALDAFDYVTTIDENDFGGWLQKGNALFHLNRFEESLECYHQCEGKVAFPDLLQVFMGECYEKLDQYENAKACYKKSLELNAQNSDAWTGMGICCLELDAATESIEYLQKSLALDAENYETWVYLAEAYVNTNQVKEAETAYEKSLTLENDQPDTWVALGNIYIDLGHYQAALDCYSEAFKQDNSLENIQLFLSIAYFKLGNNDKALSLFNKARELNPEATSIFLDICPEAKELIK